MVAPPSLSAREAQGQSTSNGANKKARPVARFFIDDMLLT
jgi:hypothetical protein